MTIETNQINALGRYAGTTVAAVFTTMGALAIIPADTAKELITQLHILQDAIQQAVGAIGKMWVILGPIGIAMLARVGFTSSSIKGMLGNITKTIASDPQAASKNLGTQEKTDLASATVELAKNSETTTSALLDKVTELPQVNAILTDAATAHNTQSPLVKAGAA